MIQQIQKNFRGGIMDKIKKEFINKFLENASKLQLDEMFNKAVELETGKNNFVPYVPYYPREEKINPNDWMTITSTEVII
jgi:hypothetical protein